MFVNGSERNQQSLWKNYQGCFPLSFGSFGPAVSEQKIFLKNRPFENKNCLWRPCFLAIRDEMNILYKGHSKDASNQMLVHFWKALSEEMMFLEIDKSETRIACDRNEQSL